MNPTIGLLVPRSVLYPAINFDILEGLRAGLGGAGTVKVVTENIGVAANTDMVYAACERMLMDGVPVVAAYVNPVMAVSLQPLFAGANALLIVLDSGSHFLTGEKKLPNVVFLSLHNALCNRIVTQEALDAGFRTFSFVTSFYDAGYRPAYAIARTIERAGASIVFNHVTALKRKDFTLQPLTGFLGNEPGHALIASFCGDMAIDFCAHIGAHPVAPGSLFGGPFMGEETYVSRMAYPGTDMTVCIPWSRLIRSDSNRTFLRLLEERGRIANIFSLLGYEAGMIADAVLQSGQSGEKVAGWLTAQTFDSPRGNLGIDTATQQSIAPVYIAVLTDDNGTCRLELQREVNNTQQQWALLQEDISDFAGPSSDWLNAYPCLES